MKHREKRLTAKGRDRGVDRLDQHALPMELGRARSVHLPCPAYKDSANAHLLESFGVQQDPSDLYHLGGVLRHIDTMLVTRSGDMDHNVTVDAELGVLLGRHGS